MMEVNFKKSIAESTTKRKSKQWLAKSLLKLMKKKDYFSITISEIAKKADLSRRTFYRHFQTKEDILEFIVLNLCEEYTHEIFIATKEGTEITKEKIAFTYFTFWNKHKAILKVFFENNLLFFILEKYNEYIPQINNLVIGQKTNKQENYALYYHAGGFFNVLYTWIKSNEELSVQELCDIVSKIN